MRHQLAGMLLEMPCPCQLGKGHSRFDADAVKQLQRVTVLLGCSLKAAVQFAVTLAGSGPSVEPHQWHCCSFSWQAVAVLWCCHH